jgi:hypothetical protein
MRARLVKLLMPSALRGEIMEALEERPRTPGILYVYTDQPRADAAIRLVKRAGWWLR